MERLTDVLGKISTPCHRPSTSSGSRRGTLPHYSQEWRLSRFAGRFWHVKYGLIDEYYDQELLLTTTERGSVISENQGAHSGAESLPCCKMGRCSNALLVTKKNAAIRKAEQREFANLTNRKERRLWVQQRVFLVRPRFGSMLAAGALVYNYIFLSGLSCP